MVYQDISSTDSKISVPLSKLKVAASVDRLLAHVLDFLIFSPLIALMVAHFLRDIRTYLILDENSLEASLVGVLFFTAIVVISIILQSLFLYRWSATPGQIFLHLRVVNFVPQQDLKLTFSQCLLRSVLWWVSIGLLALPFLEVLSHPLRRPFHDRASDTFVATLRAGDDHTPALMETRIFTTWLKMVFLFLFVVGVGTYFKIHNLVKKGYFTRTELVHDGKFCDFEDGENLNTSQRLDILLALNLLDEENADCLNAEADFALWNREGQDKPAAYLAKSFLSEDKKISTEYQQLICEEHPSDESCAVVNYLESKQKNKGDVLRKAGLALRTSRVLLLKKVIDEKNYISAMSLVEDLNKDVYMQKAVEALYVKVVWLVKEAYQRNKRSPAGAEFEDILSRFKKRYDIP